jgi:hypothetical protein
MTATKPIVIDIYYGDEVRDFALTKAFGIRGVIHKASEGVGFADKLYATRRRLASDLGLNGALIISSTAARRWLRRITSSALPSPTPIRWWRSTGRTWARARRARLRRALSSSASRRSLPARP